MVDVVTLFVKAGRTPDHVGSCLHCQSAHLLVRLKHPNICVVHVDLANPPPEFSSAGLTSVPAVMFSDGSGSDQDVLALLSKDDDSKERGQEAQRLVRDIYAEFCAYMHGASVNKLVDLLRDLDNFLKKNMQEDSTQWFLFGNTMSVVDCEVVPQLHEIRVTMERIRGFPLPQELRAVWMYLFHSYQQKMFVKACPTDMEILLHWTDKLGQPKSVIKMPEWLPESSHAQYFSFNVPFMAVCPPCNC